VYPMSNEQSKASSGVHYFMHLVVLGFNIVALIKVAPGVAVLPNPSRLRQDKETHKRNVLDNPKLHTSNIK